MTFSDKNRKKIFLCSLVLFFISLIYRILNPFTQPTVKELTYKGKNSLSGNVITSEQDAEISELKLHYKELFYTKEALPKSQETKDLFYKQPPYIEIGEDENEPEVEVEIAESATSTEDVVEVESEEDVKKREKDVALSGIVEELLHLKVIGASKTERKLSFFIKDGNDLLVISRGDKVKGRYPITDLTQDYILIKIPEFNEDVRINLKDFNGNRYF